MSSNPSKGWNRSDDPPKGGQKSDDSSKGWKWSDESSKGWKKSEEPPKGWKKSEPPRGRQNPDPSQEGRRHEQDPRRSSSSGQDPRWPAISESNFLARGSWKTPAGKDQKSSRSPRGRSGQTSKREEYRHPGDDPYEWPHTKKVPQKTEEVRGRGRSSPKRSSSLREEKPRSSASDRGSQKTP
jgi:hypothetical protein